MTEFGPQIDGSVYGPKAAEHQSKLMGIFSLALRMRDGNRSSGEIASVIERGINSLSQNR